MDAIHHQSLERFRILHLYYAPESKAFWVLQILPKHIVAGAVRLVFHIAEHLVQHRQLIILIDQQVFVRKADIFLPLKHGVLRISIDNICTIDQFLIAGAASGIVAGDRRFCHSVGEAPADDLASKIGIDPHKPRVTGFFDRCPFLQDFFHRALSQHIIRINASVQLCMNIGVSHIVRCVHPAVFLVNVSYLESVVAPLPAAHQLSSIVRGAVIHDQPDKVFAVLTAEALVSARQRMSSIVGGGKDCEGWFNNSIHKR